MEKTYCAAMEYPSSLYLEYVQVVREHLQEPKKFEMHPDNRFSFSAMVLDSEVIRSSLY